MVVGLIAAATNGTGLPLMIIIFGDMTNSFVLSGVTPNVSEGKKLKLDFSMYQLCFITGAKIFLQTTHWNTSEQVYEENSSCGE